MAEFLIINTFASEIKPTLQNLIGNIHDRFLCPGYYLQQLQENLYAVILGHGYSLEY